MTWACINRFFNCLEAPTFLGHFQQVFGLFFSTKAHFKGSKQKTFYKQLGAKSTHKLNSVSDRYFFGFGYRVTQKQHYISK